MAGDEILEVTLNVAGVLEKLGVMKVRGAQLDMEYLRRTAAQADLGALLSRALEDSGLT